MILLGGIPSESSLVYLRTALEELDVEYRQFNQRQSAICDLELCIGQGGVSGTLRLGEEALSLSAFGGIFLRLMDDRILPELEAEPAGSPARRHTRALHDTLYRWLEVADGRVVNRSDPQGSNGSKPFQAQLIRRLGFRVPETIVTNEPDEVLAFQEKHRKIVFKSMSGVRSIVKLFDDDDLARLELIRWCPVQFQEFVPGKDVRVHVIDREVYATEIVSDVVDYRYAKRSGGSTELRETELPAELATRCVELAKGLELAFAGIDLRIGPDGEATCFEVNPAPAYAYYEANTGQPIALALARYLASRD